MKAAILALTLLLVSTAAGAQSISKVTPVTAGPASMTAANAGSCTATGTGCVVINLGGYAGVGVQLTGTWSGTVTFEITVDGTNWVADDLVQSTSTTPVSTSTGNGVFVGATIGSAFRVRFSTRVSGTVVATIRATMNVASSGFGTGVNGTSGAPVGATYIVQTSDAGLTNEQVMASLATGIVKNTTTTGTQSIAVAGTDYQAPITGTDTYGCFYDSTGVGCSSANFAFVKTGLATPADLVLTASGGTGTNYCYAVIARNAIGQTAANDNVCVSGPATLNGSGNNINIQTSAVSGSVDCLIYRETGGTEGVVTTTTCGSAIVDIGTTSVSGANAFLAYENSSQGVLGAAHLRVPSSGDVAFSDLSIGSTDWSFSPLVSSYLLNGLARIGYHGTTSNRYATLDVVLESTDGGAPQALQAANFASGGSGGSITGLRGVAGVTDSSTLADATGVAGRLFTRGSGGAITDGSSFRTIPPRVTLASEIPTLAGYTAEDMTGGTNTYGFRGKIASGSGKYNLYIDGTAPNYLGSAVTLGNGIALQTDTTTAHTALLQAYDNDTGPAYVTCGTLTNGNSPSFALSNAGGCAISITGATSITATQVTGSGSAPAVTDTSGGTSCGAAGDPSMVTGSTNIAGHFNVGAGGGTDCTLTFTVAAPNKWVCSPSDETSAVLVRAISVNTTTTKFQGVMGAADKVAYLCVAY